MAIGRDSWQVADTDRKEMYVSRRHGHVHGFSMQARNTRKEIMEACAEKPSKVTKHVKARRVGKRETILGMRPYT